MVRSVALAAVFAFAATAASAVTFTFGSESGYVGTSYTDTQGGIELTVTTDAGSGIWRESGAFSVTRNPADPLSNSERVWIDTVETLSFSFDPAVTFLTSFVVERGNTSDGQTFSIDNGVTSKSFTITDSGPVAVDLTGSAFTFSVSNTDGDDGIRIKSVTVSAIPSPPAIVGVVSAFALSFGVRRASQRARA